MAHVFIRDHERGHKSIMSQAWFAFVLGLDPSSTRSVIDRFQQARSLPSRRVGNLGPMVTLPPTTEPIMAPGSLAPCSIKTGESTRRLSVGRVRCTRGRVCPRVASARGVRSVVEWHTCAVAHVSPERESTVVYVRSITRGIRTVVCERHTCTVAYTCGISVRTVVSNYGARILIVYSTRHALGGKYFTLGQVSEASP